MKNPIPAAIRFLQNFHGLCQSAADQISQGARADILLSGYAKAQGLASVIIGGPVLLATPFVYNKPIAAGFLAGLSIASLCTTSSTIISLIELRRIGQNIHRMNLQ